MQLAREPEVPDQRSPRGTQVARELILRATRPDCSALLFHSRCKRHCAAVN